MSTKKHFITIGEEPDEKTIEIRNKVAIRNRQDYDKLRTPEYIEKANMRRRETYDNDETHKLKILSQCKKNHQKHKEKYNKRNREYDIKKWWGPIIRASRYNDKKYDRYNNNDYINKNFLISLLEKQNNKCFYCKVEMTPRERNCKKPTRLSIERINNEIEHTKTNCIFSCLKCNLTRQRNISHMDYLNRF